MKEYIKDGHLYDGDSIIVNGVRVFNPTEAQLESAGYTEYVRTEASDTNHEESNDIRIARLKEKLTASDYKVIKNIECAMADPSATLLYNPAALKAERQAIRDEINSLED